jgi:hypothetical protein
MLSHSVPRNSYLAGKRAGSRLIPAPHVIRAVHAGQTVLLDPKRGRYHSLDELSSRIWELAADSPAADAVVERLLGETESSRGQAESDVSRALDQLHANQLLEIT